MSPSEKSDTDSSFGAQSRGMASQTVPSFSETRESATVEGDVRPDGSDSKGKRRRTSDGEGNDHLERRVKTGEQESTLSMSAQSNMSGSNIDTVSNDTSMPSDRPLTTEPAQATPADASADSAAKAASGIAAGMHDANNAAFHDDNGQLAAYGTTGPSSYDWVRAFSSTPQGRLANEQARFRSTVADLRPDDPVHAHYAPPLSRNALEETEQRLEKERKERANPKTPKSATDDPVWDNEEDPFTDND